MIHAPNRKNRISVSSSVVEIRADSDSESPVALLTASDA